MQQGLRRVDAVEGEDGAGDPHDDHRDDPDPQFAARQTAGRIGRLEDEVDVKDCSEPEDRGEDVNIADQQLEAFVEEVDPGLGVGRQLAGSKGLARRAQFAAAVRIKVAGGAFLVRLPGIFLGRMDRGGRGKKGCQKKQGSNHEPGKNFKHTPHFSKVAFCRLGW